MADAGEQKDWTALCFATAGGTISPLTMAVITAIALCVDVGAETIYPGTGLEGDLGVDEVQCIDLKVMLENEFGIEIPIGDAEAWDTAGDVVSFVRERVMRRAAT